MKEIYTDGSCSRNPGPGGFGVVITEDGHVINATQARYQNTTNNRMEMAAILWAMRNYGKEHPTPIVYSDSGYCVNSFTIWWQGWKARGWLRAGNKPLENLDLIKEYDELYQEGYRIDLRQVKGHAGILYNELADQLATASKTVEEVMNND